MKAFFIIMGLVALYLLGHLLLWRDAKNLKIPKIPKITKKPQSFDDEDEDDWPQR